jgi:type IV pilus assembly protein PilB
MDIRRPITKNVRVADALQAVERAPFLPEEFGEDAIGLVPLEHGQSSPAPHVIARLLDVLDVKKSARVYEIGTGSGYTAALLGQLAAEVWTTERIEPLALLARKLLSREGHKNVHVMYGNGLLGAPKAAPFDRILVSATLRQIPDSLKNMLVPGGQLVAVLGPHLSEQRVVRVVRVGDSWREYDEGTIRFSSLLGDVLVNMGAVPRKVVEESITHQTPGRKIGEALLEEGLINEGDLYAALARQHGLKTAPIDDLLQEFDPSLLRRLSRPFLERNQIIPLRREGNKCRLATRNTSLNLNVLAQVLEVRQFDVFLVSPTDYRRIWAAIRLGRAGETLQPKDTLTTGSVTELGSTAERLEEADVDSHMVALFEALLLDATSERASDIHLERYEDDILVRFRVDGRMHDIQRYQLTTEELQGIVNVIKISSQLDIAERRLPQGGRLRRTIGNQTFDLRVQTQPSLHGEHVIIRLLPQNVRLLSIEDLGFPGTIGQEYRRFLRSPQGLVLVVGPTGSGKSTTLYAGLKELADDRTRKVLTIEDPIEYSIRHVQQSQVRPDIGFSFQHAMRAFVREDPDVILVGEIRDHETALEAIRASQTGHLVLSTLHCNDAVDAVQRLYDLQMHPNSIASELLAVISQRLARRICAGCREPYTPKPEEFAELFPEGWPDGFQSFRGRGCPRCSGVGGRGRIAIVECLHVGAAIRRAISQSPSIDELRLLAYEQGHIPMRDNALKLVQEGIIPLSEMTKLLSIEQLIPWELRYRNTSSTLSASFDTRQSMG